MALQMSRKEIMVDVIRVQIERILADDASEEEFASLRRHISQLCKALLVGTMPDLEAATTELLEKVRGFKHLLHAEEKIQLILSIVKETNMLK